MGEASKHAVCSPSGASGWMLCANWGSNTGSSKYSREGTAAHELAAKCLTNKVDANSYFGFKITVEDEVFTVDDDMAANVQKYLDLVRDFGGELYVEQRLSIEHITGESGAEGTSDSVVLFTTEKEILIVDLKFGRGVEVDAVENEQLQIYALAALDAFSPVCDFETARLVISQPRLNHISEWSLPIPKLLEFGEQVKLAAKKKLGGSDEYNPGESQCLWCAKKSTCPALLALVSKETENQFDILTDDITPETLTLVELWIKGKRSDIEKRLLHGDKVPHWKLVRGKQGHRKWTDEESAAEILIQDCGLTTENIHETSLLSPTVIEKLLKNNPDEWEKLNKLVIRTEGKVSVAPEKDKRPALDLNNAEAGFDILSDNEEE